MHQQLKRYLACVVCTRALSRIRCAMHAGQRRFMCADDASVTYDMVCYKCGLDINCALKADPSQVSIAAVQASYKAACDSNRGKSCANQLCKGDLAIYTTDCFPSSGSIGSFHASTALVGHRSCLTPFNHVGGRGSTASV